MKKNGKVKEYNKDGIIYYYGEYLEGRRWNGLGITFENDNNKYYKIGNLYLVENEYINGDKFVFKFKIPQTFIYE